MVVHVVVVSGGTYYLLEALSCKGTACLQQCTADEAFDRRQPIQSWKCKRCTHDALSEATFVCRMDVNTLLFHCVDLLVGSCLYERNSVLFAGAVCKHVR